MSRAYKCDRCSNYFDSYNGIPIIENGNRYYGISFIGVNVKKYDLCPGCMNELINWIKAPGNADDTNGWVVPKPGNFGPCYYCEDGKE